MISNQLFKMIPPIEYVEHFLRLYGLTGIDEHHYFSIFDLKEKNLLDKIQDEIPTLQKYYLRCKANKYLVNITYKRSITILRQILRQHKYRIISIEKYKNNVKYLLYKIEKDVIIEPKEYGLIMIFD